MSSAAISSSGAFLPSVVANREIQGVQLPRVGAAVPGTKGRFRPRTHPAAQESVQGPSRFERATERACPFILPGKPQGQARLEGYRHFLDGRL